jgi:hypothetical protein
VIRLIILAFLVAGAFALYRVTRGAPRTRLPAEWDELADLSPSLRRILERRQRIVKLLARSKSDYANGLLNQIDSLIETLVELVRAQAEMRAHVGGRDLDQVAEPLRLALEDTDTRLAEAEEQVVEACDQVVAIASADATEAMASARTRLEDQTDRLRTSVKSYDEARRIARGETE